MGGREVEIERLGGEGHVQGEAGRRDIPETENQGNVGSQGQGRGWRIRTKSRTGEMTRLIDWVFLLSRIDVNSGMGWLGVFYRGKEAETQTKAALESLLWRGNAGAGPWAEGSSGLHLKDGFVRILKTLEGKGQSTGDGISRNRAPDGSSGRLGLGLTCFSTQ